MLNLYGLLIFTGIVACIFVARRFVDNKDENTFYGLTFYTLLGGIIGARIYHVLSMIPYYSVHFFQVFEFWNGGLGIWGGIIGGAISCIFYLKATKQKVLPWLDLTSILLPLGQAIGRWGNFFNQELFGLPSKLPWAMGVPRNNRPDKFINFSTFHPLFLYESIFDLFAFLIIFYLYKKYRNVVSSGFFTALALSFYSIIRFFLEFLRIDPWTIFGLNVAQCISILVLSISSVIIFRKLKNDLHFFRS